MAPFSIPRIARLVGICSLVFASCAIGNTCAAAQALPGNSESALESGIQLVSTGRYPESLAIFNQFKQSFPQDPRPYFYSAVALREMHRLSAAASEIQEAVRYAPGKPEYLVLQANVSVQLKQNDAALNAIAALGQQGQSQLDAAWLKMLEQTYLRLWKTDESLKVLELLHQRSPNDPGVDLDRAKVFVAKGALDSAEQALHQSVEKARDNNPEAYFELGKLLHQRGQIEDSKAALLNAVKQNPDNPEYHIQLAAVCLEHGEVDEAIQNLENALPSAPAFPGIYFSLGRAYRQKGNRVKADEYTARFQQATGDQREREEKTRTVDRQLTQGEAQLDSGNLAAARSLFEQAALTDPNRWEPHGYLAEMLLDSKDLDGAYSHLKKMEKIDSSSVVGGYLMARYYFARSEFGRAKDYAERVRSSRPGNSELRGFLGTIYEKLGNTTAAEQEYEVAVQLAPSRTDFQQALQRLRSSQTEAKPTTP